MSQDLTADPSSLPTADSLPVPDTAELAALRAIVEGTAGATGEEFFQTLVRNLTLATGIPMAFVAEFAGSDTRARTLAYCVDGQIRPNFEWELAETPCEDVLRGNVCHYPTDVWKRFPKEQGIESYLGVPLRDSKGSVLGHLAVFDRKPMPAEPRLLFTFRIFAARAAAELDRLRVEQQRAESEQRFRDLFEEAPIAYVHEGLDSKFLSANRAAMRILGITPEQVPETIGMSFIPDTPEAQRRVKDAFESIGKGIDTAGVLLELRRKDNGQPIWIRWWSRPDPGGKFTRTMFVDVTEQVLMEKEQARLRAQNAYLQEEIKSHHNFEEIVGRSPGLLAVLNNVRRVAATDASVLIRGETGTGKELIARAIHSASSRRDKPLIKINCAALPTGLVESELFGHEKGAFTGAISRRLGRFELADGGTIFLDEVGEIPLEVQAKLLRALQEREIDRVGGKGPIKVDVRVIAATNRDLAAAVAQKTFREDLFYRLNVFPVSLPPLRERTGDIPLLVGFLLDRFASRLGRQFDGVSEDSIRRLRAYRWPGNVRELENVIERAVILSDGPQLEIAPDLLPGVASAEIPSNPSNRSASPQMADASLQTIERQHILAVLRQTDWVIEGPSGAALRLEMHPNTLRSRMKKLGISRATDAPADR